jgi:hypothetical protein
MRLLEKYKENFFLAKYKDNFFLAKYKENFFLAKYKENFFLAFFRLLHLYQSEAFVHFRTSLYSKSPLTLKEWRFNSELPLSVSAVVE